MFQTYYLYKNKNKVPKDPKQERDFVQFVKVYSGDDISSEDLRKRSRISDDFLFCGIFDVKTNNLVSKEPTRISE